jgi:hypothetical protein
MKVMVLIGTIMIEVVIPKIRITDMAAAGIAEIEKKGIQIMMIGVRLNITEATAEAAIETT